MKNLITKLVLIVVIGTLAFSACDKKDAIYNADMFVEDALITSEGVSVEDVKNIIDTAEIYLLLDVREAHEHNPGYIPGSVNLPRGIIEFNIGNAAYWESMYLYEPLKTDLIIVYCKKGKRGILAAATLKKMGYTNVKYLDGGFKKWALTYPNDYERNEEVGGHDTGEEVGGC